MSEFTQVALGDVCTIIGGGTPKRANPSYFGGEIPWVTPTDVTALDGPFIEQTKETITKSGLQNSSARLVPAGTVLMTSRATIGCTAVTTREMATNQGFANLICGERIDPQYLAFWIKWKRDYLMQLSGGTTFKEIPKATLKKVNISLPPLDEQQRIVGILNRAAKIERLRAQARERLGEFIPALFNKMFGGGGMSFPVVQLGDLCLMDRQGIGPDDSAAAGLPFVGVENVESQNGIINFANDSRVGSQKSTTFRFDERHILYAKLRPYLNKVATPDFAGRCSTELVPLLPRDGVVREFIAHLLRRKQTVKYVMASVTGSRMPRTDMKALMLLPVPLPPLDEQRRFARIVDRARAMGALAENGSATASALSASLMSRLLI